MNGVKAETHAYTHAHTEISASESITTKGGSRSGIGIVSYGALNIYSMVHKNPRAFFIRLTECIVVYFAPSFQDRYPSPTLLHVYPLVLAALWASYARCFVGGRVMMNVVRVEVLDWSFWPEKDELRDTEGFFKDKVCGTGSGDKCMLKFKML